MTGVFVSNILNTVVSLFSARNDARTRENLEEIKERFKELKEQVNITQLHQLAADDILKEHSKLISNTNQRLKELWRTTPEIAVTSSYIVAKILMRSAALGKTLWSFKTKTQIDIQVLSTLFETALFDNIVPSSTVPSSVS